MTDVELGWLAGIMDGEGCIYAKLERGRYVNAKVQVIMCNLRPITRLHELSGLGYLKLYMRKSKGGRPVHGWFCYARDVLSFLKLVVPHLTVKQAQAEAMIALLEHIHPEAGTMPRISVEGLLYRQALVQRIKDLKKDCS